MQQIFEDVWQTRVEQAQAGVFSHAYYLKTVTETVLLYNTAHKDELEHMAELGAVSYQMLSHRHEVGDSLTKIKQRFAAKLCCHRFEEKAVESVTPVDVIFEKKQAWLASIEIMHSPGHTGGSISFMYDSPSKKRYLFTGNTLFFSDGCWQTQVLKTAGGSKAKLKKSLLAYRPLAPDVVFWSVSATSEPAYAEVTESQWQAIIDAQLEALS